MGGSAAKKTHRLTASTESYELVRLGDVEDCERPAGLWIRRASLRSALRPAAGASLAGTTKHKAATSWLDDSKPVSESLQ